MRRRENIDKKANIISIWFLLGHRPCKNNKKEKKRFLSKEIILKRPFYGNWVSSVILWWNGFTGDIFI